MRLGGLRELQKLRKDPLGYLAAARVRCPGGLILAFPGGRVQVVFTPAAAHRVLLKEHGRYGRCGLVFDKIRPLTGDRGLVQLEGGAWKALRQHYARLFTPGALAAMTPGIDQAAARAVAGLAGGGRVDIVQTVTAFVLENALRLFAGLTESGDGRELARRFLGLNERCGARMLAPFSLPSLKTAAMRRALDRSVDPFLATSPLGCPAVAADLLRDQVKTFLFAGHETTTSSIVSTLHLLAQSPELQRQWPELQGEGRARFLANAYNEALRLYPPAWLLVRTAVADDPELGVVRGDHIFLAVREIHRHPDHWEHPDEFRPARFDALAPVPGRFIPYGAGPKNCIGQKLASLEAAALLAPVLDRFTLSAAGPLRMSPHATLFPSGPVPLDLEARA